MSQVQVGRSHQPANILVCLTVRFYPFPKTSTPILSFPAAPNRSINFHWTTATNDSKAISSGPSNCTRPTKRRCLVHCYGCRRTRPVFCPAWIWDKRQKQESRTFAFCTMPWAPTIEFGTWNTFPFRSCIPTFPTMTCNIGNFTNTIFSRLDCGPTSFNESVISANILACSQNA